MAGIRYKGQIFSGAASFGDADHVAYDNTESGLTATDVQGAVDEISLKRIKYKEVTIPSLSIPANSYYVEITNYRPTDMPNFLFAVMYGLWSTTSRSLIGIQSDGRYAYGDGGSTFTNLIIRYFYTD